MSLAITKRPILDEGDPLIFRWSSVENPVNYELQRTDLTFTTIADNGGFLQCVGVSDTSEMSVGDVVFFSEDGAVYADQLTTVLTVDSISLVTLNITFIAISTTGFINLNETRTNYRVDVFFFDTDDVKFFTEGTEYQPNDNGFLRIDTSGIMRSFLEAEYVNTQNQENISLLFYIEVIERFSGTTGTTITDSANPVGIILASKQLLDVNGSIMKEQTPVVTQSGNGFIVDNQAEFLTRFAEPSMWIGFPNFIFGLSNGDNVLSGVEAFVRETALDINRAVISSLVKDFTGTKDEINRISLDQSRLDSKERFRLLEVGLGVSLKTVIDAANLLPSGGAATTMREAGTIIETDTAYTRVPALTGPDSLLELATFI